MIKTVSIFFVFLLFIPLNGWGQKDRIKDKVFKVSVYLTKVDEMGDIIRNKNGNTFSNKIRGKAFLLALNDSSIEILSEGENISYPVKQIAKMKFKRKGAAGKGAVIGFGAALVTTGAVALSGGGLGTVVVGFFGGIFAPPVGAIIGSNVGKTYLINDDLESYRQVRNELKQYLFNSEIR